MKSAECRVPSAGLLSLTPEELATACIDTRTYLAVSRWQWVMRAAERKGGAV